MTDAEATIVDHGYRRYLGVRHTATPDQLAALIDAGIPRVFGFLGGAGVAPGGAPFIRYHSMGADLDLTIGVPVDWDAPSALAGADDAGLVVGVLPAGRHARLTHTGPYDRLVDANRRLVEWAAANGHVLDGALGARVEHYVTDPSTVSDPSALVTLVEEPIRSGPAPVSARSLAELYDLPAQDWDDVSRRLADNINRPTSTWLSTVNADGRPHAAALGAIWVEGWWWFVSGPGTRKSRDLAGEPRCAISTAVEGMDVSVEGRAEQVTDPEVVARMAAVYASQGWPCDADGDALTAPYSAPSAGPPPWHLYRQTPDVAHIVSGAEPPGATLWRF